MDPIESNHQHQTCTVRECIAVVSSWWVSMRTSPDEREEDRSAVVWIGDKLPQVPPVWHSPRRPTLSRTYSKAVVLNLFRLADHLTNFVSARGPSNKFLHLLRKISEFLTTFF